ncbi:hypothetical protein KSP40_PGU019955 [Platanthera guangdongensis]|uniref:Pyruvate kinase n=1 Tax=Platanthera guangdongensis TaxID=2320717 RepID=A0ABR2MPS4_9ASPA
MQLRAFLRSQDLHETQIYAKVENAEGLEHFDEILQEADGIILSRGNLGIDLPPEKVFLYQKSTIHKCNLAGKPAIITRVMDSMTGNLRPTRAEATDVANAVLDGADCILLGAETLRGVYPVEAIRTVGSICAEYIPLALKLKREHQVNTQKTTVPLERLHTTTSLQGILSSTLRVKITVQYLRAEEEQKEEKKNKKKPEIAIERNLKSDKVE